jgi:hypothetical protein
MLQKLVAGMENEFTRKTLIPKPWSISSYHVAQAFQPAGSGDFPVASFVLMKHGTRMSREPADKNVCATD